MNGRRLYDLYTDETARAFTRNRGGWNPAEQALPAWPSLSDTQRKRWNALAARITPRKKGSR